MNSSINMSVSTMTRSKDKKAVYVLFTDEHKMAEYELPKLTLLSNKGFSEEEISQLTDYVKNQTDYIMGIGKEVNPMKEFLGEWKKEK